MQSSEASRPAWDGRDPVEVRTVEVQSPSNANEASWVFLAGAFVVLVVIYVAAFERYGFGGDSTGAAAARALLPYQVLFRDLGATDQRMFRAMQEGSIECIRLRGTKGGWPEVETLAAQGVPPFAADPLDKTGLQWNIERDGLITSYVGVPASPTDPGYLIFVQEPDPVTGEKAQPAVVDEEHRLLPDGKLLHVTYWKRPNGRSSGSDPAAEGWQQIRIKTPLEELEEQK